MGQLGDVATKIAPETRISLCPGLQGLQDKGTLRRNLQLFLSEVTHQS